MPQNLTQHIDARGVATVTLQRPDVHNAFDELLIAELTATLMTLGQDPAVRVVVLTGAGESFSAGADLNWMRSMAQASQEENREDSMRLADLMRTLAFLPRPTIARVNGSAFGGGVGLIACCDVAFGVDSARFGLTEVKLGLVPAVISPYVVDAIGSRQARRYFQSGALFNAQCARDIGLLHAVTAPEDLDTAVDKEIGLLLKGGPQAQRAAKALVGAVSGRNEAGQKALDESTAKLIASLRVSPEGQEGIGAFLDKRKAQWIQD